MNTDRAKELWAKYLAGSPLSGEEENQLMEALGSDPGLRKEFLRDVQTDGFLRVADRADRDRAAFERSVLDCFGASRDAACFIDKVDSHVAREGLRRRSTRRWKRLAGGSGGWKLGLVAAGLVLGFVVVAALISSDPGRRGAPKTVQDRPKATAPKLPGGDRPGPIARPFGEERSLAEAERKAAEARLAEADRRLREAEEARGKAEGAKQEDLKRKSEDAFRAIGEERKALEQKLREAREREEAARKEMTPPAPPLAPQEKTPSARTESAVAKVGRVEGEAYLVVKGEKKPAATGQEIGAGQGIETGEANSIVEIAYPDESRLEMGAGTVVRELKSEGGKRVTVEKGLVRAEVAKQPKGQPMVLQTPHGEATVLGTTLRIVVDPDPKKGTRLEVAEGRVELKRKLDGKTVDVMSGHYAIAAVGVELAAKPMPVDEIQLLPRQGKIAGSEWRLVKDEAVAEGFALEALQTANYAAKAPTDAEREKLNRWFMEGKGRSWVVFTFQAEADKEYWVWVRGRCLGQGTLDQRFLQDSVMLEVANGRFTRRPTDWFPFADSLCAFDGFGRAEGYWWSGGFHDPERTNTPIAVRFARPGLQTIRMHACETPMRVDGIWLSATQSARPKPQEFGPVRGAK